MIRFFLVILFLSFFGFTSSVLAYDTCDVNNVFVPCTYNGVDYDSAVGNDNQSRAFFNAATVVNYSDWDTGHGIVKDFNTCNNSFLLYYDNNHDFVFDSTTPFLACGYGIFTNSVLLYNWNTYDWDIPIVGFYETGAYFPDKTLTINRSPELGGGVVVTVPPGFPEYQCGTEGQEECDFDDLPYNSQVTLEAQHNEGYAFSHWEINSQIMGDTDGTIAISMSEAKNVTAVFVPVLNFPLSGTLENREMSHFFFGDTWTYGECPTGTYKKHVGVDLSATVDEEVQAAHAGTVRDIFTGQHSQWADAIVVENADGQFTTVYWHVIKYGSLTIGDPVTKGQQIATIANLGGNTHFHFGFRWGSYDSNLSLAGALPEESCGTSPVYPAFPENFVNPNQLIFE